MNTLKQLVKDPSTMIVDVRNPWEFESEHVPCAKNIPLEEINDSINKFKTLNTALVIYCRSGNRSNMAVNILKQNGIDNAYNGGSLEEMKFYLN